MKIWKKFVHVLTCAGMALLLAALGTVSLALGLVFVVAVAPFVFVGVILFSLWRIGCDVVQFFVSSVRYKQLADRYNLPRDEEED